MVEAPAPSNDPVVMLTAKQLKGLGVQKLSSVIHPAYRSRYIFADGGIVDTYDIAHRLGGRARKPGPRPVVLVGPDGVTPIVIAFDSQTEAAEVQDIAQEAYENADARYKRLGKVIDTDTHREQRGLPSAESFDQRVREHMDRAIRQKKRTMVTGHHYDMNAKYAKGQAQQVVPGTPWKESA